MIHSQTWLSDPTWDDEYVYVEFNDSGEACTVSDRYARHADEAQDGLYMDICMTYGDDSQQAREFVFEDYRDPVYLGPYVLGHTRRFRG